MPLAASSKRWTYGKKAGGKNWSSLVGSVMCQACSNGFKSRGTVHRCDNHPNNKGKTSNTSQRRPSLADSSTSHDDTSIPNGETSDQEEEEEEEEECMVCLGEGRIVCIAPCGHFWLCGSRGDPSRFDDEEADDESNEFGRSSSSSSGDRGNRSSSRRKEDEEENEGKKKKKKTRPCELCPICCEEMCWPWVMTREE